MLVSYCSIVYAKLLTEYCMYKNAQLDKSSDDDDDDDDDGNDDEYVRGMKPLLSLRGAVSHGMAC